MTTVLVRTVDDQITPAPIDGVLVRVYDASGVFVTEGVTGSVTPGEIEFSLPGSPAGVDYILRLYKTDVSFLPQPRVDITVTDVDPPATVVTGHIGATSEIVTLVAETEDAVPLPIESAIFKIYSIADSFLTEAESDVFGEAVLSLPAAQYIVRVSKPGWVFSGGPTQTIEVLSPLPVGSTNTFEFPAEEPVSPQSNDPNLCLLSGYFVDVAMRPLRNLKLRIMPIAINPDVKMSGFPGAGQPSLIVRKQILNEAVFETNDEGYVELLLPRGGVFDVHIHGYEIPSVPNYCQIYVPDASWARLEEVLFPYPASVEFDPTSLNLAVGDEEPITPTITGSNTQELDNQYAQQFIDFTVADPTIVGIAIASDGTLTISGLAPGSTTLTAARSGTNSTYVPRRPDIPDLVVTPVVITVT